MDVCSKWAHGPERRALIHQRLAEHEYPRLIEYLAQLPTTTTGKIMRRELRLRV